MLSFYYSLKGVAERDEYYLQFRTHFQILENLSENELSHLSH